MSREGDTVRTALGLLQSALRSGEESTTTTDIAGTEARAAVARMEERLAAYDAAADKFIAKVESGRAHSRETYAELKAARAAPPLVTAD